MANMNYAAQYAQELANAYPYLSYFGDLWNGSESARFRPLSGKVVYIPSMTVTGAKAANRDQITGVFDRNFDISWQAAELSMDREWDTLVDPLDIMETNEVATIANVTKTFNELQKVPEMDAYMASKLATVALGTTGGASTTALTSANILEEWDKGVEYMTNARVNRDRVRCAMTPAAFKLLKEAAGLTRFVDVTAGIQAVDRNVAKLDGIQITEVPADLMKTKFTFTTGFVAANDAQQINFILFDPMAIAAPIVYDQSMISAPTAQTKGKYLYYERYYYDVFVLNNRKAGVYASVVAAG